jgi:hypothetical protein
MASVTTNVNGILSPPSQPILANDSISLSAKRKRDDSNEVHSHTNGLHTIKSPNTTAASTEDAQANIKDLIDILKG